MKFRTKTLENEFKQNLEELKNIYNNLNKLLTLETNNSFEIKNQIDKIESIKWELYSLLENNECDCERCLEIWKNQK